MHSVYPWSSTSTSPTLKRGTTRKRSGQPGRSAGAPGTSTLDDAASHRSLYASGQQGELWFRLQRHQGGLYVEREEFPRRGLRCLQSLHFRDACQFEHWCDNDPARFEHPQLHVSLKRDADALWRPGAPGDPGDGKT